MVRRFVIHYDARGEQQHPKGDFVHWPDYQALLERAEAAERALAERAGGLLDPDMPAQEMRLHMGEMTAQEMRTARAAIRWANTRQAERAGEVKVRELLDEGLEILNGIIDNVKRRGNYSPESTCVFIDQAGQCLREALSAIEALTIEPAAPKCPQCDFGIGGHEPNCPAAPKRRQEAVATDYLRGQIGEILCLELDADENSKALSQAVERILALTAALQEQER